MSAGTVVLEPFLLGAWQSASIASLVSVSKELASAVIPRPKVCGLFIRIPCTPHSTHLKPLHTPWATIACFLQFSTWLWAHSELTTTALPGGISPLLTSILIYHRRRSLTLAPSHTTQTPPQTLHIYNTPAPREPQHGARQTSFCQAYRVLLHGPDWSLELFPQRCGSIQGAPLRQHQRLPTLGSEHYVCVA